MSINPDLNKENIPIGLSTSINDTKLAQNEQNINVKAAKEEILEKSKPKKLSKGQKKKAAAKRRKERDYENKANPEELKSKSLVLGNNNLRQEISEGKPKKYSQEERMIDVYRLRIDDDYVYGGQNFHGLYKASAMDDKHKAKMEIIKDFLLFTILAQTKNQFPDNFDFQKYLTLAKDMIQYAFEKSDITGKYGPGVSSSLRRRAEKIFGYPMTTYGGCNKNSKIEKTVDKLVDEDDFRHSKADLFKLIGGKDAWVELHEGLKVTKKHSSEEEMQIMREHLSKQDNSEQFDTEKMIYIESMLENLNGLK